MKVLDTELHPEIVHQAWNEGSWDCATAQGFTHGLMPQDFAWDNFPELENGISVPGVIECDPLYPGTSDQIRMYHVILEKFPI